MTSIPYTYLIGWTTHNKWYYGRRTSKNCHPDELWKTYFTSSKHVAAFVVQHSAPDVVEVRKLFPGDPGRCAEWESRVLRRIDAQHSGMWLNMKNGDSNWDTTGRSFCLSEKTKARIRDTNIAKYGVGNPSLSTTVQDKRRNTFHQRYGVSNSFHRKEFQDQAKATWLEKYGVDNPNKRYVICRFCGEKQRIMHEYQCAANPNRLNNGHPGSSNGRAKTIVLQDPTGTVYTLTGEFTQFCKDRGISPRLLRKNKTTKGWRIVDSDTGC